MRRFLTLFAVLMLFGVSAFSQSKTVTGTVKDDSGNPVPFATVTETGTKNATLADAGGQFVITQKGSGTLTFSATGFKPTTITPYGNPVLAVLVKDAYELSAVVVTALGINRSKNSLPYAAQQVSGDDLSMTRSGNAGSELSGKVSGVEIRQGNGIGGSTNIVIRGTKSLTRSNQAMFVVDGVPVDNSNTNSANQTTGRGGYDYGNAAADINPDDIATMTVLKGAAATALYGSKAANGVIMITTKKARKGLGITVNSALITGSIDKSTYARYQNQYGAGYSNPAGGTYGAPLPNWGFWYFDANGDGTKDLVVPTTEDASYGQKFDPNLMVYHWDAFDKSSPYYKQARPWVAAVHTPVDFYENSLSTVNNVNFDGANDKGSFKLGYTRNDEKGILPNSRVLKNIVNFGATYNLTNRLTAAASMNFSKIDGKGRYGTGYDKQNPNQNFRQWYQTNMDVYEQRDAFFRTGQNITWNWADPSKADGSGLKPIYSDNPYWTRYKNFETDSRSRYFGYASLNYKATDWLNLLGRVSLDSYDELQEERIAVGSVAPSAYTRFNRSFRGYNYDLMANFDKSLTTDIDLKGVLGTNINRTEINSIYSSTNGGLVVPDLYSIANSLNPISSPTENYQPTEVDGYYAGVTLGYHDMLFLDGTFRRDISSTLPKGANGYNYFSASGSWVFSKNLPSVPWLTYGKLRANYAEVGSDAPWGSVKDIYSNVDPFGSAILFSLPSQKNNNNLKPERTFSKELGVEMIFFKGRLGFDATYYITNTRDQLIPVNVSPSTGYLTKIMNAGDLQNKGIELSVNVTPVKTKDFSWDLRLNWSQNRNKVVALFGKSENLPLASFQGGVSVNAPKGQPYGQIWGKTWVIDSATGQRYITVNGRDSITTSTTNNIGNVNPNWIGGIYNTVRYKNLALSFLIDIRKGGSVFSLDSYYGMNSGLYAETVALNDLGNPSRDPVLKDADGKTMPNSGGIIVPGITKDGKPNTKRVPNIGGTYGYGYNPAAGFVYDASYVKLRELSLTYSLPATLLEKVKGIKGIDLSLIGRNLWIIHKNTPYSDPEENLSSGNYQGYQSGSYPTTRSIGLNLKLKF
jgi:TonB-linked SusC/RagA family outer membrane protein